MKRLPKDAVRALIVKNAPPAPGGMKKRYDPNTRTVNYVMKTAREQMRERLPKKRK